MPSIQIDLPTVASPTTKQELAHQVGAIYADIMQVGKDLLTVSVHDLGQGESGAATDPGHPRRPP